MNILVSCVPFDHGKSGISVYIRNAVAALAAKGHKLTLILEQDAVDFFPGYDVIVLPKWARSTLFSMLYHLFILPFRLRWKQYDACLLTAANRRVFCRYPIFTVAVVHDLSQYHVEAKYDAFRMFYIMHVLPFFVRRAPAVLAISQSTADDLKQYWRIAPDKISVVYNGLSLCQEENPAHDWQQQLGLTRPYVLYISRLEHPGKNHVNLIKAYDLLPQELAQSIDIVMPGASWSGSEAVFEAAKASRFPDHLHFPGFMASRDMKDAYQGAACYVFPSAFEGFGLSLIEAMHYGIPCACSKTSSLGEIGRDAALLFDPNSPQEIADCLKEILTSKDTQARLAAAGIKRAAQFTWENHANGILGMMAKH